MTKVGSGKCLDLTREPPPPITITTLTRGGQPLGVYDVPSPNLTIKTLRAWIATKVKSHPELILIHLKNNPKALLQDEETLANALYKIEEGLVEEEEAQRIAEEEEAKRAAEEAARLEEERKRLNQAKAPKRPGGAQKLITNSRDTKEAKADAKAAPPVKQEVPDMYKEDKIRVYELQYVILVYSAFLSKRELQDALFAYMKGGDRQSDILYKYGPIRTWNVVAIKDMSELFEWLALSGGPPDHANSALQQASVVRKTTSGKQGKQYESPSQERNIRTSSPYVENTFLANIHNDKQQKSYSMSLVQAFNADISGWDTKKCKSMRSMFAYCKSFNQPLAPWNTGQVEDMSNIFLSAESFDQPLDTWNVENVEDLSGAFQGAKSFNQPLGTWKTSNVRTMNLLFNGAESFDQPGLETWDTSSVEYAHFIRSL